MAKDIRETKEMLKALLMEVVGSDVSIDAIDYSLAPKPGLVASGLFVSLNRDPGDGPNTPPGAGVYRFQISEDNSVEYRPFVAEQDIEFAEAFAEGGDYTDLPEEYQEAFDAEIEEMRAKLAETEAEMERRDRQAHQRSVSDLLDRRASEGRIPQTLQGDFAVSFSEGDDEEKLNLNMFLSSLDHEQLTFFSEWSGQLPTVESVHPELFGAELTPTDYSEEGQDPIEAAINRAADLYRSSWQED